MYVCVCVCVCVLATDELSHVPIIQEHFMFLAANLSMDMSLLRDAGVISAEELDQGLQSANAQNVTLIKLMFYKPRHEFDKFLSLLEQHQTFVHRHISNLGR